MKRLLAARLARPAMAGAAGKKKAGRLGKAARNRWRRTLRKARVRLLRKTTGPLRSALKQFERESYLAPF